MSAQRAWAALLASSLACAGCNEAVAKPPPNATSAGSASAVTAADADAWKTISRDALCTTSGATHAGDAGRFAVDAPTFRAIAPIVASGAELDFVYEGATATARALGSGAMRRQIGLKLMARNPCNLVYAMWRIDDAGAGTIVVQTKRNVNQATSSECGNRGYTTVRPRSSSAPPLVLLRSRHVLRSELTGSTLRVVADGALAWEGSLPNDAVAADAPIGIRSDNVRFEGELRAEEGTPLACASPHGGHAEDENAAE